MNFKFDGSRVYFTSDTHFNHTNIISFCQRPFKNVDEMNERIIANWNEVVVRMTSSFIWVTSALAEPPSGQGYLTA